MFSGSVVTQHFKWTIFYLTSGCKYNKPQLVMIDMTSSVSKANNQAPVFFARLANGRLYILHNLNASKRISIILLTSAVIAARGATEANRTT